MQTNKEEHTCVYVPAEYEVIYHDDDTEEVTADPAWDCDAFKCSECEYLMIYGDGGWFDEEPPYRPRFSYCPNCGAKVVMRPM